MGLDRPETQPLGSPTRKPSIIHKVYILRAWTGRSLKSEDLELGNVRLPILYPHEEIKIFEDLITLLVNHRSMTDSLRASCQWYRRYLKNNIINFWPLIRSALNDVDAYSPRPSPFEFDTVIKFLLEIARPLVTEKEFVLSEIVDSLANNNYFKQDLVDSDEYRIIPNQLVFAMIGWLLLLYEAPVVQRPLCLQIKDTLTTSPSSTGYLNSRNVRQRSQDFGLVDRPIHLLLYQFGDIIPEVKPELARRDSLIPVSENIEVHFVCYATALNVMPLVIEWVDSLGLHLELDESRKTLKLFRFPSYCQMMYHKQNIHMRLLTAHAMSQSNSEKGLAVPSDQFFKELLLTYRVLFGQDETSYKAFHRSLPNYDRDWDCSGKDPDQISDPLLPILCGKSCRTPEACDLYNDVDAGPVRDCYDSSADFPIMGQKLLQLQAFVRGYNPKTLKALMKDRRNPVARYKFWTKQTLLVFACLTIVISILQLVFQIWQVVLAQKQLAQPDGASGN